MNEEELEQKSIEYELKVCGVNANQKLRQAYMDGFRDCLKEWHKNYLSCSSLYCSSFFADVSFKGELGNMTKEQTK